MICNVILILVMRTILFTHEELLELWTHCEHHAFSTCTNTSTNYSFQYIFDEQINRTNWSGTVYIIYQTNRMHTNMVCSITHNEYFQFMCGEWLNYVVPSVKNSDTYKCSHLFGCLRYLQYNLWEIWLVNEGEYKCLLRTHCNNFIHI